MLKTSGFRQIDYNRHTGVLPPVEEKLGQTVRDARAIKPLITVSELHEHLEKQFGRRFSRSYLKRSTGRHSLKQTEPRSKNGST